MDKPLCAIVADQPRSGERNPGLDGLRGLAALSVAAGHCVLHVGGLPLWGTSLRDFPGMSAAEIVMRMLSAVAPSDVAVVVFFVLSGHVLWSSFQRKGLRFFADGPDYACARVYRLFPLAIISGVLLGFLANASARELTMNMLLLSHSLNGVLWSLQVEVVASLALFALWGITRGTGWKLLLALVLVLGATPLSRGNPYVVFLPAFILGASVSVMPARLLRRGWVVTAAVGVLLLTNVVLGHGGITRCFEIASAAVLVGAVARGRLGFLRSGVPLFLGAISYPFYLTHWIGLTGANWLMGFATWESPFVRVFVLVVLSVGLTIPVAWLLHVGVENPVLRGRPRIKPWRGGSDLFASDPVSGSPPRLRAAVPRGSAGRAL